MRFLSTFGRLPNTWLNLVLIVISGTAEGFGLSLFIPLLHMMGGNKLVELPRPFPEFVVGMEQIGWNVTTTTLLPIIIAFSLFAIGINYIQRKILIISKERYALRLRDSLFGSLVNANWTYSSNQSHGEFVNQFTLECSRSGNALNAELMAVATISQILLLAGFSILISWKLMIITTVFGLIIFMVIHPLTKKGKILGELTSKTNRDLSFFSLEYLRNLKIVKSMAGQEFAKKFLYKVDEAYCFVTIRSELNSARVQALVQAFPVILLGSLIYISFELLNLPVSLILVFMLFMMRIAPRMGQLQQYLQTYYQRSPAVKVVANAINSCSANIEFLNPDGAYFERIEDAIDLTDVSYTYPESEKPAIKNVSISIPCNKMVAIVGISGAGKSTLIDILAGLRVPDSGHVSVDGVELSRLNLISWRKKLGIVTQDASVFNTNLRENLDLFDAGASPVEIQNAISISHLTDVVEEMSQGLDTELGENGIRLSGGQKQRVVLARAVIRKPELLLLDEATSALDNESERFVQDAINNLVHTMTIVVIAHRLSTVRRADNIFVMNDGEIVESGTYNQLMEQGGRFAELRNLELY